jgi:hypothetical protein
MLGYLSLEMPDRQFFAHDDDVLHSAFPLQSCV